MNRGCGFKKYVPPIDKNRCCKCRHTKQLNDLEKEIAEEIKATRAAAQEGTMGSETVVMYDSPEAATLVEVKGWKSRLGHFYPGENPSSEHGARWSGCTHQTCSCGNIYEHGRVRCNSCQAKIDCDKYYALPIANWDGTTPTCDYERDKFFWTKEELMDEMYWQLEEATKRGEESEMHVVIAEPHYLRQLDGSEWSDDLPYDSDGELPSDVGAAIDALNAVLKAQGPSCWYPGKERIDMDALWKELKSELRKPTPPGAEKGVEDGK